MFTGEQTSCTYAPRHELNDLLIFMRFAQLFLLAP